MNLLEKRPPLPELDLVERRMRRFFDGFGFLAGDVPAADVFEAEGELVFELEVPGFDEKELTVDVSDHTLVVKGERLEDVERQERTLHLHERLERRFERRFDLPPATDPDGVTADYGKGVLTVRVPLPAERSPRSVEIAT